MNKRLVGWSVFAVALGIIFRTASDVHDGLSLVKTEVGWLAWHFVNWMSRDLWQLIFVFYVSIRTLASEKVTGKTAIFYIAANLAVSFVISLWWHDWLYDWTLKNLKLFDW